MDEIGPRFLENIVTEDETPLSLYIPFSRRESKEWVLPGQKPANVLRHGTTHKKIVMLTLFWDVKGHLKVDFTDGVINSDYYKDLINEVRNLRRKPRNHDLYLLHDNNTLKPIWHKV